MLKCKKLNPKSLYFSNRIIEAMSGILEHSLTVVEAPMGYGKTTAVREYLQGTNARVLWQRIFDSSPNNFWKGFARLFGEVDEVRSRNLVQLGFPSDGVSRREALRILDEIQLSAKTVLVIDDYHLIDSFSVNSFIELLAENEITNLHIVLTARFTELPNLEELKLKGYLQHVIQEAFELLPQEIAGYYRECGINLKASEAEELYSFTEGWISALYLMMLNYIAEGSYTRTENIFKLIEIAIYVPFSEEIKDFLLTMCIFDSFTLEQACHMFPKENAGKILAEITNKNAFVKYDPGTKTYQIHKIFTNFLQDVLENKTAVYRRELCQKAAQWHLKTGDYLASMHYFYRSQDFDNLLKAIELDRGNSFYSEQKDLLIKYFAECPAESKHRHPLALLIYALCLMTFNEMELFSKVCGEFTEVIQNNNSLPDETRNRLLGEFELLLSFMDYNDVAKMSVHHRKACALLKEPSEFMDTNGCWTFGAPSVLYLLHREPGRLAEEVRVLHENMPYYYQLTNGHGNGAEFIMSAERHFHLGDQVNAEIGLHQALYLADVHQQPEIAVCALFLQVRLALLKGDFLSVLNLFEKMRLEMKKMYALIHTIDLCEGFTYALLRQRDRIPRWIAEGDFHSSRLFFPAIAFANIVYGRVLLISGENLKLLGSAEHFAGIASVLPNLLANVYTRIYMAAANRQIYRNEEAFAAIKQALEMAMPDKLYLPFVENCDYLQPLLEQLYREGMFQEDIARILELATVWQKAAAQIAKEHFSGGKAKLTKREREIAELAAEGLTNKEISEKLFISTNTVKTQLKSVFEKRGVKSRALLKQCLEEKQ